MPLWILHHAGISRIGPFSAEISTQWHIVTFVCTRYYFTFYSFICCLRSLLVLRWVLIIVSVFCNLTPFWETFLPSQRLEFASRKPLSPSCFSLFRPFFLLTLYFLYSCNKCIHLYHNCALLPCCQYFDLDGSQWFAPAGLQPYIKKSMSDTLMDEFETVQAPKLWTRRRLSVSPPARNLVFPCRQSRFWS